MLAKSYDLSIFPMQKLCFGCPETIEFCTERYPETMYFLINNHQTLKNTADKHQRASSTTFSGVSNHPYRLNRI